jgi:hypothetical protein
MRKRIYVQEVFVRIEDDNTAHNSQFTKYKDEEGSNYSFLLFFVAPCRFSRYANDYVAETTFNHSKMVLLASIPEFSTMCMNALDAFESINTCKGTVFDSLNCSESAWRNDSREDEGVEVAAEFESCRACEQDAIASRQGGDLDTISVSSSFIPSTTDLSDYKQRRHIKMDSFTTFLPYDDDDIFRSRQASQGSDSQCFRLCRLHRCTAFSQDSAGENSSNVHPLKRDLPLTGRDVQVRMVHWDELVEDSVVNAKILE